MLDAVKTAQPEVIVHQMTALFGMRSLRNFDKQFAVTSELRTKGTDYLLEGAPRVGTRRFIAQSFIGWNNRGSTALSPPNPIRWTPPRSRRPRRPWPRSGTSRRPCPARYRRGWCCATALLRPRRLDAMIGLVRKRQLPVIGGGTGIFSFCEVTDAAVAAVAAVTRGAPGLYNIVDDDPAPVREWLPYLSECLGRKPPMRAPAWLGRLLAGQAAVAMMTEACGAANEKARRELGWAPQYASWRDGFRPGPRPTWRDRLSMAPPEMPPPQMPPQMPPPQMPPPQMPPPQMPPPQMPLFLRRSPPRTTTSTGR